MSIEVICAGFGRTGTLSLKSALEQLGFGPGYHMMEVLSNPGHAAAWSRMAAGEKPDWSRILGSYRSVTDWPAVWFWRELVDHYPEAKVIMTVRDPGKWWQSISDTIFHALGMAFPDGTDEPRLPPDSPPVRREQMICARDIILQRTFAGRISDREHCISVYQRHNETVRKLVPPDRLLIYEVKEGWEPLCGFLQKPIPQEPFPRTNSRDEFIGREV